jgi:beta-lactamase regulating signal transducer with metallopeptidase domain/protein involved in polysaccharide export with SLBB domain/predicted  nucleic acid-binding Zn-ribbon protein
MNAWLLAGWTMLHFIWVGALVAAAGAIVRLAVRRCGPNVRYASSLAMLAVVACAPVVIACALVRNPALMACAWEPPALPVDGIANETASHSAADAPGVPRQSRGLTVGDSLRESQSGATEGAETYVELKDQPGGEAARSDLRSKSAEVSDSLRESHAAASEPAMENLPARAISGLRRRLGSEVTSRIVSALPLVWLVGAPVTFLLLAAGLVGSRRLTRSGLPLGEGRVAEACARLCSALRVSRRVAVAAVEGLAQPVLVGIVKPTILLPAAALNGWTVEELEMVLVHELAHVRRWDNLVNLGQRVIEAALFFHPCVWLASRQVRRDREECCDWVVVQHTQAPEAYAELLVSVASQLRSEPGRPRPGSGSGTSRLAGAVMALAGASPMAQHALVGRVRRILKLEDDPMWISRRMMGMLVMLSLVSSVAVYRAFAVPAPVLNADADAFAEVGVKSDRARPEAAADDASKVVNYFMADIEAVDPIAWLRITATDGVNVRWFEENKSVVINASQEVHEKIADLLEASRRAQAARRSAPTWNVTMLQLQQQLQQIERDLADAEVMKQVAIQQSQSPVALDEAVAADLDRDPQMEIYKAQISALNDQIQNLNDPAASAAGADHGTATRALLREIGRIQRACDDYRKTAAATIRERLSKVSNEAVRAAMAAYNVRVEHLTKKKQALEKQLTALEAKVNALTTEEVEERGDRPATVERTFPFDPVLFECAKILGEAPELSLDWDRSDDRLVIVAPERVHDALMVCYNGVAKGENIATNDEFPRLFAVSGDNPQVTVAYSFAAFDELLEYKNAAIEILEGFVRDPYGPKLPISLRQLGDGQVEVTMPRAGHAWLRLMTTQESPLMRTAARKKADDDGERAEDAAGNPLAVDESGSTQRESELLVNADGSALLDAEAVTKEELGPRLGSRGYMPRIRLRAVAGLPYKQVVAWMDALREAGVRDIAVDVRTGTAEAENQPDGSGDPYATTDITSFPVAEDGAIEFPADANPALVKQTIENLTKAGWKIDIRNGTWYIRRREAEAAAETKSALAARTPYRIGPGDTLLVRTLGAAPDWPVDGQFMVEDEGTIALGPAYGRVEVAGLTVREAEAAVLKVLKETLSDPKVQVTIVGKARGARREARAEDEPLAIVESPGPAIESGDLLWIEVEGTLPDQPIKGPFTVSRDGELHFGPSYGVVEVAGLNSVDAEMRIRQKLSEVLTECRVLVRVLKKSNGASGEARRWTHGVALPEDMGDAEAQWVAEAIERQGIGAKAFENGGKLVLEIATPTPLPPFKVVWEAHQVGDRMQRMCRFIGEDGRDFFRSPFGEPAISDPYQPPVRGGEGRGAGGETSAEATVWNPSPSPSLRGRGMSEGTSPSARLGEATPLYDGRTFDEWRGEWRSELKVERRMEAVEALAAFARAGYGREAAEALLDVAGEYDFTVMDDLPEGKLKQRVVELLTMHLPKSIQTSDWFPVLVERFKADPDKWRSVMRGVLGSVYDADEAMQTKIRELMDNPEYDVALPAWQALVGSAGNSGDQEERVRLLREGLASENTEIRKLALSWTGFATEQLEKIPEPFEMLFSDDAEIALEARQQLAMTPEKYRAALAERLWAVVDDPERDASHVAALRGIGVLYGTSMASHAQDSQSDRAWRTDTAQRLIKHLQDGPREEWAAAAWALDDEWDADASKFKGWIRTGNISKERLEEVLALKQDISKEREAAMGPPNRR